MTTVISKYADALLAIAEAEGDPVGISDQIFQVAQAVGANDDLRTTLSDRTVPASTRQQIVEDLLGDKLAPATTAAVSLVVAAGRAGELPDIARALIDLVAEGRSQVVAEVRSAVPLSDEQVQRLAAALSTSTGKDVAVKVVIDPTVLGGIVTQIGDTVIDGSVRHRLNQLRESLV